jgi:hypothetical protein
MIKSVINPRKRFETAISLFLIFAVFYDINLFPSSLVDFGVFVKSNATNKKG